LSTQPLTLSLLSTKNALLVFTDLKDRRSSAGILNLAIAIIARLGDTVNEKERVINYIHRQNRPASRRRHR
jgi:hypothetical protein